MFAGADQLKRLRAGVRHVGADVQKVLEEPEAGECESGCLALKKEIERTEQRNKELSQRPAKNGDGVSEPAEEEVSTFVDDQIDVIDKEESRFIRKRVEKKKSVENEPGNAADARNRLPFFRFEMNQCHERSPIALGNRLATNCCQGLVRRAHQRR